jgi:hypothetical protein
MTTITRKTYIASVPDRWREQYGPMSTYDKLEIQRRLDSTPPSKKAYDKIIGNSSWTRLTCDACGNEVKIAVFIDARASDEYGMSVFCKKCLEAGLKAIDEAQNGK